MTVRGCAGRNLDLGGGSGGVGTESEPVLHVLCAEGKPATWTVGGTEGKPAKFGTVVSGGGVGTEDEPELRELGAEGEPIA